MKQYRGFKSNGWLQAGLVSCSLLLSLNIAAADTWKFVCVADTQSGLSVTNSVNTNVCIPMARQIVREKPDLVLVPGDLIYGNLTIDRTNMLAQYAQWTNAFSSIYAVGIPIYPIRGNHETYGDDTNATDYLSVFGSSVPSNGPAGEVGLTYSVAHNNALFIGLDEYKHSQQVNQAWLNSQLASNRYPHVFVFGHEPAVQVVEPECLALENAARDLFLKSITEAGCRMYLCAHDHFYNRGRLMPRSGGSIMQVVSGAGGAPFETGWDGIYGQNFNEQAMGSNCFYNCGTNGYVLVTVSNFNVTLEWKGSTDLITWTTYDTYSYQVTNPAIRNPTDFDGDSKADLAVYRAGFWSILTASGNILLNNNGPWGGLVWIPVPGDYDGDGRSDLAVYRNGYWSILTTSSNVLLNNNGPWGGPGWTPVPGDYDGDGRSDLAVYRNGYWSILTTSGNVLLNNNGPWGGPGWTPVPGDYDGDGKSDLAVYRNGYWSILTTSGNVLLNNNGPWGGPGWIPVPGDYDGDGKADLAVYRDGYWSILTTSGNVLLNNNGLWGGAGWTPVPGDYDGDGKADLAVYRDGYWSILTTSGNVLLNNNGPWGGPDSIPVK